MTDAPEDATTFCKKCVAWNCTTTNCPGHQRWPEKPKITTYWSEALQARVTIPED